MMSPSKIVKDSPDNLTLTGRVESSSKFVGKDRVFRKKSSVKKYRQVSGTKNESIDTRGHMRSLIKLEKGLKYRLIDLVCHRAAQDVCGQSAGSLGGEIRESLVCDKSKQTYAAKWQTRSITRYVQWRTLYFASFLANLKSPLRYTFWQSFGKLFIDKIILDLFSGAHT